MPRSAWVWVLSLTSLVLGVALIGIGVLSWFLWLNTNPPCMLLACGTTSATFDFLGSAVLAVGSGLVVAGAIGRHLFWADKVR